MKNLKMTMNVLETMLVCSSSFKCKHVAYEIDGDQMSITSACENGQFNSTEIIALFNGLHLCMYLQVHETRKIVELVISL